jgi:uncharacterized membrane protein YqgA involved in biofilm formation
MIGIGTIINCIGIILGGLFGLLFGRFIKEEIQDSLTKACGVCVLFIGISGALEDSLFSSNTLLVVGCIALGTLIGELLNIERLFESFGEWLKEKTGNAKDKQFVEAFVLSSLTVCIGAMAIVGAIEDGITGDYSILVTKAILDLIIIMVMTAAIGKAVFSLLFRLPYYKVVSLSVQALSNQSLQKLHFPIFQ